MAFQKPYLDFFGSPEPANLRKSLIFRGFPVELKEPHPNPDKPEPKREREYGTNGINGTNGNFPQDLPSVPLFPFVPYSPWVSS
jgi:hypothetical protein